MVTRLHQDYFHVLAEIKHFVNWLVKIQNIKIKYQEIQFEKIQIKECKIKEDLILK